jgi:superfamily II DNA or RNA helicase
LKNNDRYTMANNFITNNKEQHKTLKSRINTLISVSDELKFLVGFFYFSGWEEVYKSLKLNESIKVKLLVGLQVDKMLSKVVEHDVQDVEMSQDDQFSRFMTSMGMAVNNNEMDTEAFYNQVVFFLEMLEEGRLIIRKTENPNHSKLYLFKLNETQASLQNMKGQFITGSSNLTKAGLSGQEEFNVEIKDYGFEDAEAYFDTLWEKAIPISEIDDRKQFLIEFVQHKSQAAIVSPYEAYALILKTFLDLQQQKLIKPEVEHLLAANNFKKYSYQTDAVNQALSIIKEYNGVIIGDVVGLGKSVIAAMIAKNMGKRGVVICPPGLIGNKTYNTGWWGYINNFKLHDWEIESRGKLIEMAEHIHNKDIDVVIVDEAHYFRNQDTADYEALMNICRGRTVILLTATPFNNSPADIFSLLKLFIVPGKSGITIEDNLEGLFRAYNYRFSRLSDILKNAHSRNPKKREKAEKTYIQMFGEQLPVDFAKVRFETQRLSSQIKNVIAPVLIRRNRLDLKTDHIYASEIDQLSEVKDPRELYYELSENQSTFYDEIIDKYFGEDGRFSGAIYQPFMYVKKVEDEEKLDEAGNRVFIQQRNLYDFMRRLLVKRFESSFGAFAKSIDRFLSVHELVKKFIENSGGKYIMDRGLMEKISEYDEDEILEVLFKFENDLLNKKIPKNNTVYTIEEFELKKEFLSDIDKDIEMFKEIRDEIRKLDLVSNDPKRESVYNAIVQLNSNNLTKRKLIIFSEYVDTVKHLEPFFREKFGSRLLVCDGSISHELSKTLSTDFDAQFQGSQTNHFDILLTSDKLSEGFNLNRAGTIINYDIPWNPTRVIQRIGRINRIGTKVFDELFIFNLFPTERGADIVKSREIASQKMFLIHNALGEDAKIFEADEEPSPSGLYNKINQNPDQDCELNIATVVRNKYNEICNTHPEVIEKIKQLPARVKTAKAFQSNQLNVLRRKGLGLFAQIVENPSKEKNQIEEVPFEDFIGFVGCEYEEKRLELSPVFWHAYEAMKHHKPNYKAGRTEQDLASKSINNLKLALKITDPSDSGLYEFIKILISDIRKYHTLSMRTMGRLGRTELKATSGEKEKKAYFDEIRWIRNQFGHDYLDQILKRIEGQSNEVIISVEGREMHLQSRK